MTDSPKMISCPFCSKDVPLEKVEENDGKCTECGYSMRLDRFFRQFEQVRQRERDEDSKKNPQEKKKPSGLTGFGL